ncbi:uncharacterized protein L3040_008406 [Drepanopeziza brunnea f. sp. 'multigermtubi']|uniref:Uncharacterized protein n=1 Tax=Marssonina brunnea f. sp. multigermtubi (strain MB_m1) TaxID=1072389 RepID=K1XX64_MARBU|nr:uncharacterized protein MBM_04230 [Drepanopeziza brunnea f. sp. 'multigermtubi' MB_m1]EKD17369.1 hypothetical protein MBM_04230 [Drepanopeziza brunnea f. sp. 'multigermtubi' MB_m1]KAJ5035148.1 hypothetical protein L3040_008406 [Drepanopeziza brunnea f. sp. 'multigermtubi']
MDQPDRRYHWSQPINICIPHEVHSVTLSVTAAQNFAYTMGATLLLYNGKAQTHETFTELETTATAGRQPLHLRDLIPPCLVDRPGLHRPVLRLRFGFHRAPAAGPRGEAGGLARVSPKTLVEVRVEEPLFGVGALTVGGDGEAGARLPGRCLLRLTVSPVL